MRRILFLLALLPTLAHAQQQQHFTPEQSTVAMLGQQAGLLTLENARLSRRVNELTVEVEQLRTAIEQFRGETKPAAPPEVLKQD